MAQEEELYLSLGDEHPEAHPDHGVTDEARPSAA
jgi:hypothetical protein